MANEATEHILRTSGVSRRVIETKVKDLGIEYMLQFCRSDSFIDVTHGGIKHTLIYADKPKDTPTVYDAVHYCVKAAIIVHSKRAVVFDLIKLCDQLESGDYKFQPLYLDDSGMNVYKADIIAVTSFVDTDRGTNKPLTDRQLEHIKAFLIHMANQGKTLILGLNCINTSRIAEEWGSNFSNSIFKLGITSIKIPLKV